MLEQSKLPAKQRKFAQKQQQNSESTAYGGLRTDIRSNFGFNQDEHYYTVQRISQQSLSYGTAVSRLSDNADAAPIQMLTLSDKGTTINLDNLEQFINHINVQKLKAGTPLDKFYTKMIQFNNLVDFNKILITNGSLDALLFVVSYVISCYYKDIIMIGI